MVDAVMFAHRLFAADRPAREALTLLAPEFCQEDLVTMPPADIGPKIAELGARLFKLGALPDSPCWIFEESPEFERSIDRWREGLDDPNCFGFTDAVVDAANLAEAAAFQMGKLTPRLAALRWNSCMQYLKLRAILVRETSVGGSLGTIDAVKSERDLVMVKLMMLEKIREIVKMPEVLASIDFDLCGVGVWERNRREPLTKEAEDEWYRRGLQFDVGSFCLQVSRLPPTYLNKVGEGPPTYMLRRPYGEPNWYLQPELFARFFLERHNWKCEPHPSIEHMPAKALVLGGWIHFARPPEPVFDMNDPDVIEKVQRGEDLGKAEQEDGLPGAIHGSVGLLYAQLVATEEWQNIRFYPSILPIPGFLEAFLTYCPPLRALDFGGCEETMTKDILKLLPLAGEHLINLDLEECGLGEDHAEVLASTLKQLYGLQFVDLAGNNFDADGALEVLEGFCANEPSVQQPSRPRRIRFDRNPIGNGGEFQIKVAEIVTQRGGQVVDGGSMTLNLAFDSVYWSPGPSCGSEVKDRLDTLSLPQECFALKDLEKHNKTQAKKLEQIMEKDPKKMEAPNFLRRRKLHNTFLQHPVVQQMKEERAAVYNEKHGKDGVGQTAEVAKALEPSPAA